LVSDHRGRRPISPGVLTASFGIIGGVDDRCPSCGRELGELVRVTYAGRAVIVRFAVGEGDERTELEHRCGDDPI
jgi:hypothetical protein